MKPKKISKLDAIYAELQLIQKKLDRLELQMPPIDTRLVASRMEIRQYQQNGVRDIPKHYTKNTFCQHDYTGSNRCTVCGMPNVGAV